MKKSVLFFITLIFSVLFSLNIYSSEKNSSSQLTKNSFFPPKNINIYHWLQNSLVPQGFSIPWRDKRILNHSDEIMNFDKNFGLDAPNKRLVGKVSSPFDFLEDIEITCDLLEIIDKEIQDPNERLLVTGEIVTKVLAYRDLQLGNEVSIPIIDSTGRYTKGEFVVDELFNLWNGMPAFGLMPIHKGEYAPILLFRGTDLSLTSKRSLSSILCDLDLSGPGHSIYLHSRNQIQEWLKNAAQFGPKSRVMGFSLGGSLASYTLIYEKNLVSQDKENPSLAFNSPGVTRKLYAKWNAFSEADRPPFVVFHTKNDPVSKVGFMIGDIYKLATERRLPSITAHVILISGQPTYYLRPIQKNNKFIWKWN